MKFKEKYKRSTEEITNENKDKIIIGVDAFAIGEQIEKQIENLINKIEHTRLSLNG